MSLMKIEVVPDTSTPSGGHAIIRIRGIALVPPEATFRIDPIDEDGYGPQDGWPGGDLKPLETRQTADGIEFRVGPEVVDAPLLEPGTPVTFTVADADISAELVWPTLPVSQGKLAPPMVMTPSQLAAELAAAERARAEAAKPRPEPAADKPAPSLYLDLTRVPEAQADSAEPAEPAPLQTPGAQAGQPAAADLPNTLAAPPPGAATSLPPLYAAEGRERIRPADKSLSRLTKTVDRGEPASGTDADAAMPALVLKPASESAGAIDVSHGHLHPSTIDGALAHAETPSRMKPFLAGVATSGVVAALAIATMAFSGGRGPGGLLPGAGAGLGTAAGTSKIGIADVFSAGYQSPRGEVATDVDLPTALKLADYNLHGVDRPVDRAEAEFWLKKAMSLTASHSQIRWAMTQLGTLKAEPIAGPPDYEKARILWEIAASNGDPIAMCFLGTLHEFGLGLPVDKAKALAEFKRSKTFGGCANSDEAISRLSK